MFPQTIDAGKSFLGRFGNIDTRVSTINKAAELERAGLTPRFEFRVDVTNDKIRYVDLVGLKNGQPQQYYQFVKQDMNGNLYRPDELVAAQQIERARGLQSGTVQLINTNRY